MVEEFADRNSRERDEYEDIVADGVKQGCWFETEEEVRESNQSWMICASGLDCKGESWILRNPFYFDRVYLPSLCELLQYYEGVTLDTWEVGQQTPRTAEEFVAANWVHGGPCKSAAGEAWQVEREYFKLVVSVLQVAWEGRVEGRAAR